MKIDFKKLEYGDLWIVSEEPTPEDLRAITAFLEARKVRQARAKTLRPAARAPKPKRSAKAR